MMFPSIFQRCALKLFLLNLFLIFGLLNASQNLTPTVRVSEVNSETIGLYEKFEIIVSIEQVSYLNPYDPDQIDLQAYFTAPSGKIWKIFGFWDDYQNAQQWKVRFSPDEIGTWTYYLTVRDKSGTGQSSSYKFTAIQSNYHGWVQLNPQNPHYLKYADGSSFYGVGLCYPWNVTNAGLERLASNGANIFFYWNGTYDGQGNGGGRRLIESIESGLGRYDQLKCGRIEDILNMAAQHGLKMTLVLWPHDYFSDKLSTSGWPSTWSRNPYKALCTAQDIYGNQTAWEYQKKQYRYIIARWGYSRLIAFWQIICEITGTDGWAYGNHAVAEQWCAKVQQFFNENDPFQHPTTGSQHGSRECNWSNGYKIFDLPNREMYESSGWPLNPANPLRSSYQNFVDISRDFRSHYAKPGIIGETGYSSVNVPVNTPQYTELFHNALWSSWANGLAATPFWWDYTSSNIVTNNVLVQMKAFAQIIPRINFATNIFTPAEITAYEADAYCMKSDSLAFGWIRQIDGLNVAERIFKIRGLADGSYFIRWYDTWTGSEIATQTVGCFNQALEYETPRMTMALSDLAFLISPAGAAGDPARLKLIGSKPALLIAMPDTAFITCFIQDSDERFCLNAENEVQFRLNGPGILVGNPAINALNGKVTCAIISGREIGTTTLIASSAGLMADTVYVEIKNSLVVDNFENYATQTLFETAWKIYINTQTSLKLENLQAETGSRGLKIEYSVGSPYFAGAVRTLNMNWSSFSSLKLWIKPDGSGRTLSIMFKESKGKIWSYDYVLTGMNGTELEIPFLQFKRYFGTGEMDLSSISQLILYITKGTGENGSGTLYFDDFQVMINPTTGISQRNESILPLKHALLQNYPNPFNSRTVIPFQLSSHEEVSLTLYNLLGQKIQTIFSGKQSSGNHFIEFDATGLSSGIYLFEMKVGSYTGRRKMAFIQ